MTDDEVPAAVRSVIPSDGGYRELASMALGLLAPSISSDDAEAMVAVRAFLRGIASGALTLAPADGGAAEVLERLRQELSGDQHLTGVINRVEALVRGRPRPGQQH